MSAEPERYFNIGDSILVVGAGHDGELGTVIGIRSGRDGFLYAIVFENGDHAVLPPENISYRR